MLYLLHGLDHQKKKRAKEKLLAYFQKEKTNLEIWTFDDLNFDPVALDHLRSSQGLFAKNFLVVLENVLEGPTLDFILAKLDLLKESENIFIFNQISLSKEIIKKFNKIGAHIEEFSLKSLKNEINPFLITYPFENRDKKATWVSFNKLLEHGLAPENLSGILFWKIKNLILSNKTKKYSQLELEQMSSKLISLYHDSHRGQIDFGLGLEKFILDI